MPDWDAHLRPCFVQLRLSPEREMEIIEELSHHLDQCYEDLRVGGASDAEAERRVLEELREPDTLANYLRVLRQARTPPPITPGAPNASILTDLLQDVRYAGRTMRRQPGFAAAGIVTLALGIGANSAIFALADATLLRPLPFHEPDRLVMIWERQATSARDSVAPLNLVDWNDRNRSFDLIGGFIPGVGSMVMNGTDGTAETVPRQWVTSGFFQVLGVKAIEGRTFVASDDSQRLNAVVLSEGFWRTRFNADPTLVGRDLQLDGTPYTVVGVVPGESQLFGRTSVWALFPIQGAPAYTRGVHMLGAVGRLKPAVTLAAADADMTAVAEGLSREFPNTNKARGIALEPLHDAVIGADLRLTSMLLVGVVGFVLLLCCANVANLLLARATGRARELAIRSVLGARRRRLVRQLVTEGFVLSASGGVLGVGIGAAILTIAPSIVPSGLLPAAVTLTFDARVLAFCAAIALVTAPLFALVPAWQATTLSPAQAIGNGRTATGRGGTLRTVLVVGELATAVLLLFGAGLLLRTLIAVENVDRGYRAERVLTMMVDPLAARYPTPASLLQFFDAIEHEVTALPGVQSVAWASALPLAPSDSARFAFEIVGDPPVDPSQRPSADFHIVSPTYFGTVDLPVVAGRSFSALDARDSVRVCIVSEAFVRRHLQGRSPIGLRVAQIASTQAPPTVMEIVGVSRQVRGRPDERDDLVQIYVPMAQQLSDDMYLVVRPASGRAEGLARPVRAAIARIDKEQLVSVRNVMALEDVAREATARHRFRAVLVMTFAALALLLAMVGLFGILAYWVQQRVRDFGVRRALGATSSDVLHLIIRNAIRVVAAGVVVGLALSTVVGRLITTMLFGVQPLDPVTITAVTLVLVLTSAVSIAGPAWRASRIDPALALRNE